MSGFQRNFSQITSVFSNCQKWSLGTDVVMGVLKFDSSSNNLCVCALEQSVFAGLMPLTLLFSLSLVQKGPLFDPITIL